MSDKMFYPQDVVRSLVELHVSENYQRDYQGDVRLRGEVLDVWMPSRDDPIRVKFGWKEQREFRSAKQCPGSL